MAPKKHNNEDEITTRTLVKELIEDKECECDFRTDEQRNTWFESRMFRHYIVLIGLFLGLSAGLFIWGFNKNTVDAIQDERIYEIKKSIDEIKQQGKETLQKVNDIDKKIVDNRISYTVPGDKECL